MPIRHAIRYFAVASALIFGVSGAAKAECQAFPKVSWWSNLSHQSVARYVDEKYGGNWATYTGKWERQLTTLEDIATRGKVAVVGKDGARLRDGALKDYIGQVGKRLQITHCLSRQQEARTEKEAAALDRFATAAGSDDHDAATIVTQVAGALPEHLKVEIRTHCRAGTARFQVVNMGAPWPKAGMVFIHEVGSAEPLSQRRLRLASGQSATFKIDSSKVGAAPLGLWVEPSWYARDFRYDATLSCLDKDSRLNHPVNPSRG